MAKTMRPLVVDGETRKVPVFIHEPCLTGVEWDEVLQGPIRDVECEVCAEYVEPPRGEWLRVWVER